MKIDQLPPEMLMEIFRYLPAYEEVSQVNRNFYGTVCKVNSNIHLRIDKRFIERFLCDDVKSAQLLHSMQSSNRKVSKLEIAGSFRGRFVITDLRQQICSIVENFSPSIKFLRLSYVFMNMSTFLEILSMTPNAEHLDMTHLGFVGQRNTTDDRLSKRRRCNDYVSLNKLKSLWIDSLESDTINLLLRLPVGILSELRIKSIRCSRLIALLNRQVNIKKLKLKYSEDDVRMDIFDKLKLEYLELYLVKMNTVTLAAILSKQTQLKSLLLSEFIAVDGQVMNAIADLLDLEILTMNATRAPAASFVKIRKLKKLKDLHIQCYGGERMDKLKMLGESDNTSIVKLSFVGFLVMSMPEELIAALAKSAPLLKHLKISRMYSQTLVLLMSHFNFVEVLEVPIWCESLVHQSNCYNPKLRELSIFVIHGYLICKSWLPKFIAAYPNITKLKLIVDESVIQDRMPFEINSSDISLILNGFTKLESLILRADGTLPIVEDYLQNHKQNLRFVSLGNKHSEELTDDLKKKLRSNFDVINVDKSGRLNMAIDRYAMNCLGSN